MKESGGILLRTVVIVHLLAIVIVESSMARIYDESTSSTSRGPQPRHLFQ